MESHQMTNPVTLVSNVWDDVTALETWTRQWWWLVTGGRGTPRWTEQSRLGPSGQRAPAASSPPPAHSTRAADTVGGHAEAREPGVKTSVNR